MYLLNMFCFAWNYTVLFSVTRFLKFQTVMTMCTKTYSVRYVLVETEMATHSNILAWITPWIKEFGGLQSMGSQRV